MPHSTAQDVTSYVSKLFQLWFYWLGIRDHPNQGISYFQVVSLSIGKIIGLSEYVIKVIIIILLTLWSITF